MNLPINNINCPPAYPASSNVFLSGRNAIYNINY